MLLLLRGAIACFFRVTLLLCGSVVCVFVLWCVLLLCAASVLVLLLVFLFVCASVVLRRYCVHLFLFASVVVWDCACVPLSMRVLDPSGIRAGCVGQTTARHLLEHFVPHVYTLGGKSAAVCHSD